MRKSILIAILAVSLLTAIPAGGSAATTIRLGDNFFSPSARTIGAGAKVNFRWVGSNAHNVTKASGPGGSFASPTTSRDGVNYSRRFRRPGVYRLICTLHSGMRLKLTVRR